MCEENSLSMGEKARIEGHCSVNSMMIFSDKKLKISERALFAGKKKIWGVKLKTENNNGLFVTMLAIKSIVQVHSNNDCNSWR